MINTSSNKHFITYSVHIYSPSLATPNKIGSAFFRS